MRRRQLKKQKKIIIMSSLCLLLCLCVGYAAYGTQLSLKAKGNVKTKVVTSESLKQLVVTEGDGLYADEYEDGRYLYRGANPNNYITFNDEMWRIISVEADGTIKIIRNDFIGQFPFDTPDENYRFGSNSWARPATLNSYLNNEYLKTITKNSDKIVSHNWSVGAITLFNSDLPGQIKSENEEVWEGRIALPTVSEFIRANTNIEQCGNLNLINIDQICDWSTNWMYNSLDGSVIFLTPNNYIGDYSVIYWFDPNIIGDMASYSRDVAPSLYLSSDITLSGTVSEEDPYVINE